MAAPPAIDPARVIADLRELVGDNPAAFSSVVQDFLAETPALVDALRVAADRVEAQRAAHTLKGLAATFGATDLADLCLQAESLDGVADRAAITAAIATEHERVARALRAVLPAVSPTASGGPGR